MKKKSVLLGLWRMATWHREQRLTLRLLSNNFEESRWKTAAIKNAYALMGKRRFGKNISVPVVILHNRSYYLQSMRQLSSFLPDI